MKYNKINELLVKEAFKPSKHNYGYQVDAKYTFLCIDGALGDLQMLKCMLMLQEFFGELKLLKRSL